MTYNMATNQDSVEQPQAPDFISNNGRNHGPSPSGASGSSARGFVHQDTDSVLVPITGNAGENLASQALHQ